MLLGALLARWAEVDAAGLDDAVRPYRERFRALVLHDWRSLDMAVTQAWAAALPEAALAEAMQSPNRQWARITAQGAIKSCGGDPKHSEVWRTCREQTARSEVRNAIKTGCADSAAARHPDLLPEPRTARVLSEILGKLAEVISCRTCARRHLNPDAGRAQKDPTVTGRAGGSETMRSLRSNHSEPAGSTKEGARPGARRWAEKNRSRPWTWAAEMGRLPKRTLFSRRGQRIQLEEC